MKKLSYIVFTLFILLLFNTNIYAKENTVNIYFFHSYTCPHCKSESKLLEELEKTYDNINIYKYEISEDNNTELLSQVGELFNTKITGVPFTVIGEKYYIGYSEENTKKTFISIIEYYSKYKYNDVVGELIKSNDYKYNNDISLPTEGIEQDITLEEFSNNFGEYTFKLPIIGEVNTKNLTLPLTTIVIGLVDGFNPCAMWILIFLITMLIGMKDRKKMFILGFSFLLTSGLVYFLIMLLWLDVSKLLISVTYVRIIIGLVAIVIGLINFIKGLKKEKGCTVVEDKKRNKIITKIKTFTTEKSLLLSLLGVITLAISVNIIELACSAGLPLIYTEILSLANVTKSEEILYLLIYIFFFLIDDIIVFTIAMFTLKITGVSNKYSKVSKIIGGVILFIMGILLIFFPNIVMLNF